MTTWETYDRGDCIYEQDEDDPSANCPDVPSIRISMADSHGGRHYIGRIEANEGDWEKIVSGADPVKDGWEDGNGRTVAAVCDMDSIVRRIRDRVLAGCGQDPGYRTVLDDILNANDYVSYGAEYNGLADDYDLDGFVESYIDDLSEDDEEDLDVEEESE